MFRINSLRNSKKYENNDDIFNRELEYIDVPYYKDNGDNEHTTQKTNESESEKEQEVKEQEVKEQEVKEQEEKEQEEKEQEEKIQDSINNTTQQTIANSTEEIIRKTPEKYRLTYKKIMSNDEKREWIENYINFKRLTKVIWSAIGMLLGYFVAKIFSYELFGTILFVLIFGGIGAVLAMNHVGNAVMEAISAEQSLIIEELLTELLNKQNQKEND